MIFPYKNFDLWNFPIKELSDHESDWIELKRVEDFLKIEKKNLFHHPICHNWWVYCEIINFNSSDSGWFSNCTRIDWIVLSLFWNFWKFFEIQWNIRMFLIKIDHHFGMIKLHSPTQSLPIEKWKFQSKIIKDAKLIDGISLCVK